MNILRLFFDIVIPRFITEDSAVTWSVQDERYEIVCSMLDVLEHERFDGIVTVKTFNFFGFGLFPKAVSKVKPWSFK